MKNKDKELLDAILEKLPKDKSIEYIEPIEVNGIKYKWTEIEELPTEDEGKYQYGGTIYGVGIHNAEKEYGIIGEPLFFIEQDFTKTGSYYSEQYYEYEEPYLVEKKEKTIIVWESIK
ncbi:hypothetical protein [Clostridium botulinum]|uniref:hypothetical protein n=1 Tax=Clostridium botulinum TaxID=1491 RepID=UPI001C9ADB76|nr:hypothetical protein [Clostridium botulinum]MBY6838679.1 hypothetical protein [Clostridium botulinum]